MISLPEHMSVFAVQITTDFLSGGRRGTTLENRKNCCGRVTVALVRAVQYIYIYSYQWTCQGFLAWHRYCQCITQDFIFSATSNSGTICYP